MSMEENYKRRKQEQRAMEDSDDALVKSRVRDFNRVTARLLDQFEQRLDNNEVPMNNIPDYIRLLGAFKEMNGLGDIIENGGNGENAGPPPISIPQQERLDKRVSDGQAVSEEGYDEDEEYVDLSTMSQDETHELIQDMVYEQNKVNEGGSQ